MSRPPRAPAPQSPPGPARGRPGQRGGFGPHQMGMPGEKARHFKGTFKRLLVYLRPYHRQLLVVIAMALLATAFGIMTPKILGQATTRLFAGVLAKARHLTGARIDFAYIAHILLIAFGLFLLSSLFNYILQLVMTDNTQKIVYTMRRQVAEKLARLPLRYFDARTHGEILSRVTNDIDVISGTMQQSLTQIITSLCTIAGVFVMMLTISPWLTLIVIATLPLSIIATARIAKHSQLQFAAQQKELGQLNGHIEEIYSNHIIVKAFRHEAGANAAFADINGRLYNASWRAQFISGVIMPVMSFINNIGYVLICITGGIFVTRGVIPIGDIQAFIQYTRQFMWPIAQTATIANILQSTVAAAERIFEVMDEPEELDAPAGTLSPPRITGSVQLEHIRFGYLPEKTLIEDLSLSVKPGHIIAIVGPTGAGKTTLVNLLMRFYDISAGVIAIDGQDTGAWPRAETRRHFGMVLQDTWLFQGTIRANIAYGRQEAGEEEIVRAAKTAHADHFIRALPHGYETLLSEGGANISQGERQLLTIARALLADPEILILDEATSSVDTRTEVYIQKAMATLMRGRTCFVIAHRLSTIRDAELILVMNNGAIIERGTHQELLAQCGFYAELYKSQFLGAYTC
jgi:ATP-binding cassette, subfamily B, multidrug efflux pump